MMLTQGLDDFNKILVFRSFLKNPKLLYSRASNHLQCLEADLMIIYGIVNEIKIHWSILIYDSMMKAKRYIHYPLPYALLVSRICNTYIHRDDVGYPEDEDEDEDKEMDDIQHKARPSASTSLSYSLEILSKQLSDMSLRQASRHEEVCSLTRGLDDRVHALEGLVQPLGVDDSDE
ncbi:hypothetical protein LR48_Vigan03g081900 [Vigna angularis]|uniref:Uncharacterized protein n=1 Tax=Phaseolus angularis TaxID=3914 RepID=A0A0L9U430_PHAAN|nr:hypothetical protein LR48_Vigan03g081900 [Vigna angularis]